MPLTSGHIAEGGDPGEVVSAQSLQNQRGLNRRVAGHRLLESLGVVLILERIVEGHPTKLAHERILLAVPDHRREMLPKRVVLWALLQARHGVQRLRVV